MDGTSLLASKRWTEGLKYIRTLKNNDHSSTKLIWVIISSQKNQMTGYTQYKCLGNLSWELQCRENYTCLSFFAKESLWYIWNINFCWIGHKLERPGINFKAMSIAMAK